MIGPCLLDLMIRSGADIEQVSWFISVMAIGAMAGALLLGQYQQLCVCDIFLLLFSYVTTLTRF